MLLSAQRLDSERKRVLKYQAIAQEPVTKSLLRRYLRTLESLRQHRFELEQVLEFRKLETGRR